MLIAVSEIVVLVGSVVRIGGDIRRPRRFCDNGIKDFGVVLGEGNVAEIPCLNVGVDTLR